MEANNTLSGYNQFIGLNSKEISSICEKENLNTLYFPIDGTRTYYELFNGRFQVEWNIGMINDYLEMTRKAMINQFTMFFEHGIKNLIVLAMDESAFNRDSAYLDKLIKGGLISVIEHPDYQKFYEELNVQVIFSGFNHLYNEYGHGYVLDKMQDLEKKTKLNSNRRLFIHTGRSVNDDPIELTKIIKKKFSKLPTREDLILELYKYPLQNVNLTIWYGQPRDKLFPLLIIANSARVYMENPSLSLTRVQFLNALYSTITLKYSHLDSFRRTIEGKEEKKKKYSTIETLIGADTTN
jgi:hypothetical protein